MVTPELMQKLRAAYKEWNDTRGASAATWIGLMDDNIQMRSIADGASPGMEFSKARKGKEMVRHYFSGLTADWEMIHYTVEEFLVDGDRVVVFSKCAFRNRKTGKTAESPIVNRWRFVNGLAVEYFELYDTAGAFAAATPDKK
jgi:uncharacterized protein